MKPLWIAIRRYIPSSHGEHRRLKGTRKYAMFRKDAHPPIPTHLHTLFSTSSCLAVGQAGAYRLKNCSGFKKNKPSNWFAAGSSCMSLDVLKNGNSEPLSRSILLQRSSTQFLDAIKYPSAFNWRG